MGRDNHPLGYLGCMSALADVPNDRMAGRMRTYTAQEIYDMSDAVDNLHPTIGVYSNDGKYVTQRGLNVERLRIYIEAGVDAAELVKMGEEKRRLRRERELKNLERQQTIMEAASNQPSQTKRRWWG